MIRRAYVICTEDDDLKTELSFITHIFHTINGYPQRIIERSQEKMKAKLATTTPIVTTDSDPNPLNIEDAKQQCIVIPYAGARGEKIMKKIVRNLPENVRPKVMYKGTKLSSFFSVKDKSDDHHCSNIVYYYQRNDDEKVDYIGETKVSVYPTPIERQKVLFVLQIFCEKTVTALKVHEGQLNCEGTIIFISKIIKIWKVMNVKSMYEEIRAVILLVL